MITINELEVVQCNLCDIFKVQADRRKINSILSGFPNYNNQHIVYFKTDILYSLATLLTIAISSNLGTTHLK